MCGFTTTKVVKEDIHELLAIARATFIEAYANENTPENLKAYLDSSFTAEQLTSEIQNPDSVFFFIQTESKICGYLKLNFSKAQTNYRGEEAAEVERIYVRKEFYGKGMGALLMQKAIQLGKEQGPEFLWLGVWQKNLRAIRFYEKQGFVNFGTQTFKLGDEIQKDFLMKLLL